MAALLRSGSFLRIFSGFRQSWTTNVPRCEALTLQTTPLHTNITRLLSAQKPVENVRSGQGPAQGIDKALYRIDTDIRRTGRIFKKDIEDIFGEIKALRHATSTQSLLLLRCCGSLVPEELPEVRNKLVQDIWETLHELRIPLDVSHYNTLLRVYLENEHKFSPTAFLADLEKNDIEPNRVTYQRLISRYCQDGDIDGATKILEFMKAKGLPVGENIFNALIMGHARANDMESAHKVLEVMKGSGLEPSSDSYKMLLVSYAEQGDIEGIKSALQECEASDIHLHDRDLMEVIQALAMKGHTQHVPQIIEKLQKVQGYQQDVMNLTYRLLNAGCHEVAYQMFSTMKTPQNSNGETGPAGFFFIKHLVKSGTPSSTIVHYCQEMKKQGLNTFALEAALGAALSNGLPDVAMFMLRVMNEDGAPLRAHYFWPIIIHYSKLGQLDKVYGTVKEMVTLEVPLTLETFKIYVIPAALGQDDMDAMIGSLKDAGMSLSSVINGCIAYFLSNGDVVAASNLLSRYRCRLTNVFRRELAEIYVKTGEAAATSVVLGQMQNQNQETAGGDQNNEELNQPASGRDQQDVAGLFLQDVVWLSRKDAVSTRVLPILQEMENRGISISKASAASVTSKVGEQMTEEVSGLLERLSSGSLTFQPLTRETQGPYHQQSVDELERRLLELENKNLSTINILSYLLPAYARNKDVEKAEDLKKKLDAEQYPISAGTYVLLIDMYVSVGKLAEATTLLRELEAKEPDTKLTPFKFLRLASLMVQEGQLEEAIKLIESHALESFDDNREAGIMGNMSRRMVDQLSDTGDTAAVRRLIEVLLKSNVVQPGASIFGPLIRAYLINEDLAGAMKEFEAICREHRATPFKLELTTQCINLEDADKLQKIMDMSIEIHGELNSLYDMVFAFVECGRIKQAKKLLETPGLRAFNQKLDNQCQRYLDNGKITQLENLVTVTRDIFDLDRNMMYMNLIKAYKQTKDCDKALGIWTSMQEENIQPSEPFLQELGSFLKENGYNVPFVIPESPAPTPAAVQEASSASPRTMFTEALAARDFTSAVSVKEQIEKSGGQLSIQNRSKLVEGLVQDGRISEATKLTQDMLITNCYPVARVLKYLIIQMAKAGDVETITFFGKYIDNNIKKRISFDNARCMAYRVSGRSEEILDDLLMQIQSVPEAEVSTISQHFPRGGLMGIMEESPQLLPKVTNLAEEYASRGMTDPANCVWMHLFSEGRYSEAQEIYNKHISGSSTPLMFRSILDTARKTNNTELPERVMEVLEARPEVTPVAKGLVYSCWIDVLGELQKFEEGLNILNKALETITLEDMNTTALTKLKAGLLESNKSFPYIIPVKGRRNQLNTKSSSSSSSSDSD
ncbi:leucine-rich PPR motif-containing protein, mitochondrial-like isoform X2 [Homarus americanus]|uniref:leucine-rich PPR motif-containing protein, mitochondrial-like isoform X2 n=1 Tax=Homarus americanus TaxID=6706 RepID=UPI001C43B5F1|nr:leucine-rich PPR motif-containing protein, mitochondrial-like isoform X2 [Homarus americanus]